MTIDLIFNANPVFLVPKYLKEVSELKSNQSFGVLRINLTAFLVFTPLMFHTDSDMS